VTEDDAAPVVLVVMGVSGSGKSTVGRLLADALHCDFRDGDDLHPAANRAKMAAGHPLDDADRATWLAAVGTWIDEHIATGRRGVIPCSALKRRYRDTLRRPEVVFVYLHGSYDLIARRLRERHGHFMPAALLDSQFADLEPPQPDERAVWVDNAPPPAEQVTEILRTLQLP
jgi:gluconokinase